MRTVTALLLAALPLACVASPLGCGGSGLAPSSAAPGAPALARLGGEAAAGAQAFAASASAAPFCRAEGAGPRPLPRGQATGSTVALAWLGDRALAYVADEDDGVVRTLDVAARAELAVTPVGGAPASLLVLPDGRLVVGVRDAARLDVLEPAGDPAQPLELRCAVPVAAEPVALAVTPDGATVLVASRWDHALTGFAAGGFERRFALDLPRDPRAVITSSDGKRAFVSHLAGSRMSVVDLPATEGDAPGAGPSPAVRELDLHHTERRSISFAKMAGPVNNPPAARVERRVHHAGQALALVRAEGGRILSPEVLVDPGNGVRTGGYGEAVTVFGDIAAIDEAGERRLAPPVLSQLGAADCLLPRAAALDAGKGRLLVACFGLDALVEYDAQGNTPHARERRRFRVGAGPTGVAVDPASRTALVWSQFDHSLAFVDLDAAPTRKSLVRSQFDHTLAQADLDAAAGAFDAATVRLALPRRAPLDSEIVLGRGLFHQASGHRIAADGRACASCHPDGRDDGITWTTPDGPRQTPMLMGRLADTAPYGWNGARKTLLEHLDRTLERLSGAGINASERRAVLAYVESLKPPVAVPPAEATLARGDELFHQELTGCSGCHLGDEALTDREGHDVGSHVSGEDGEKFDTPSLRFVGKSAPYFHDGRFATLEQVLMGSDGKMGHTAQLSPGDRHALATYLESL